MVTRDLRAAAMTEAELMEAIRALVQDLGLLAYHAHDGRKSWGPGFPDLVIVGRAGCIWRECKTEAGSLAPEQRQWGEMLKRAGQNWRVWRPSDLLGGSIARELTDLAAIQGALFAMPGNAGSAR
jgi:hypothetical protein